MTPEQLRQRAISYVEGSNAITGGGLRGVLKQADDLRSYVHSMIECLCARDADVIENKQAAGMWLGAALHHAEQSRKALEGAADIVLDELRPGWRTEVEAYQKERTDADR